MTQKHPQINPTKIGQHFEGINTVRNKCPKIKKKKRASEFDPVH